MFFKNTGARIIAFLITGMYCCGILNAQTITITGVVRDATTLEPVPSVNIAFPGTTTGTITDFNGKYTLVTDKPGDSLAASFIGYELQKKPVGSGTQQVINFNLNPTLVELEGVVIEFDRKYRDPAVEFMKRVSDARDQNDPDRFSGLEYQVYSKIELDLNNVNQEFRDKKIMRHFGFMFEQHYGGDSITKPYIPIILAENISEVYFRRDPKLKKGGTVIVNSDGFDPKNLRLAGYPEGSDPLRDPSLDGTRLIQVDITKLTRECLRDSGLSTKEMDRSKNMFVLGFIYWMYNRTPDHTIKFLREKFVLKPELAEANISALQAGYNFGETSEVMQGRYEVPKASLEKGIYRNITGNQATAIGIITGAAKARLQLFYGTYPITPASDILHELSKHKNFGVKTFQAEDEIAAICASIGASFGGSLGVTASSGPGIALKGEAIGLAVMLELPLVILNVQRGGPSTGLPTKTEQADLLQAIYGRNGECPVPVVAAATPADCFMMVKEAVRIAVEHMTPVFFLSDGYIANGSEPWKFPKSEDIPEITPRFVDATEAPHKYLPYKRDEKLVRSWAIPGMKGFEHRVGGLEKQDETGDVSYDPENHEKMVRLRAEKIKKIASYIPPQDIDNGPDKGKLLVLGWGSTYGAIKTAVKELIAEGTAVSHAHVRYIFPFPANLGEMLKGFDRVLIPEMNLGQLSKIIRAEYDVKTESFTKVKGIPFTVEEIKNKIKSLV